MRDSQPTSLEEITIQGVPASPGRVAGKAIVQINEGPDINTSHISDEETAEQIKRFRKASRTLRRRWTRLKKEEKLQASKDILAVQIAVISDPELLKEVQEFIKEDHYSVQGAVKEAFSKYINLLSTAASERMQSRMVDLADIRDSLIKAIEGQKEPSQKNGGDIVVAEELSPREVVELSRSDIKGLVTEKGGDTSHAAIIARSMGIPMVVGVQGITGYIDTDGNTRIFIDGASGLVTINPAEKTYGQLDEHEDSQAPSSSDSEKICRSPSVTSDGRRFTIRANVELADELDRYNHYCADGIGLLRTESIFPTKQEEHSLQRQINFYEQFLQKTNEQVVTIRLFDRSSEQFEENLGKDDALLGWRGIRMLLNERTILKDQLMAILTVAGRHPGRVKMLIPMVSCLKEINKIENEILRCQKQLAARSKPVDENIPLGMMIEIPSAAIQTSLFAEKIDFFSVGTNDLTQYLLAVNRGNAFLSDWYDQRHPAVWKIINDVLEGAGQKDKKVEICGELAGYPAAAASLIGMGVSALSISPVGIPQVKSLLTHRSYKEMKSLAKKVLHCEELQEIKALFNNWKRTDTHE
ncbi:MAG TPA: phosphoenolpyruvate--protein phosphotransferase [Balneolaceae bacterium]|nr:phosphoenolpyruvate--protein phosphotransferase [Balneolaceae bacterium]